MAPIAERTFEDAFNLFVDLFTTHVRLLGSLGSVGISLTAGFDSRSTFAVARHVLGPDLFAFTRFRHGSDSSEEYRDLETASRLAFQGGVPFLLAGDGSPHDSSQFADMFKESFGPAAQAIGIARSLYEHLPHDFYEFMSTVAETGSAFTRVVMRT